MIQLGKESIEMVDPDWGDTYSVLEQVVSECVDVCVRGVCLVM